MRHQSTAASLKKLITRKNRTMQGLFLAVLQLHLQACLPTPPPLPMHTCTVQQQLRQQQGRCPCSSRQACRSSLQATAGPTDSHQWVLPWQACLHTCKLPPCKQQRQPPQQRAPQQQGQQQQNQQPQWQGEVERMQHQQGWFQPQHRLPLTLLLLPLPAPLPVELNRLLLLPPRPPPCPERPQG